MKLTKLIVTLLAGTGAILAVTAMNRNSRYSTPTKDPSSDSGTAAKDRSSTMNEPKITIDSVEFFAWWWSDTQIAAGIDIKNSPQKDTYVQLERWQNLGDAEVPHPDRVDVVCSISNRGERSANLTIFATGDFKVASYGNLETGDKKNKALDEALESISWSRQKELGVQVVEGVGPGETRVVKFKEFNLRSVLDEYSAGRNGDLWPWKFRVRVEVKSSVGLEIARSEKILDLIPGD